MARKRSIPSAQRMFLFAASAKGSITIKAAGTIFNTLRDPKRQAQCENVAERVLESLARRGYLRWQHTRYIVTSAGFDYLLGEER